MCLLHTNTDKVLETFQLLKKKKAIFVREEQE